MRAIQWSGHCGNLMRIKEKWTINGKGEREELEVVISVWTGLPRMLLI